MAGYHQPATFSVRTDSILDLPDDLLFSVCQFLPLTDLVNMRQVPFVCAEATLHVHAQCVLQRSHCNGSTALVPPSPPLPSSRSAPCSRTWWTRQGTSRCGPALLSLISGRTLPAPTAWPSSPGERVWALTSWQTEHPRVLHRPAMPSTSSFVKRVVVWLRGFRSDVPSFSLLQGCKVWQCGSNAQASSGVLVL